MSDIEKEIMDLKEAVLILTKEQIRLKYMVRELRTNSTKKEWYHFKDFYPLPEWACALLRENSGKHFSSKRIGEILLKMSEKKPDITFACTSSFFSYMSKVLYNERAPEDLPIYGDTLLTPINKGESKWIY